MASNMEICAVGATGEVFGVGDRVMFARSFLRSAGIYTGSIAFQQGSVFRVLGKVLTVQWDHGTCTGVLDRNLVRVDRHYLERN